MKRLQPPDVERILRDVLSAQGLRVSAVRAERRSDGWRVTVTDTDDRIAHRGDGKPRECDGTLRHPPVRVKASHAQESGIH